MLALWCQWVSQAQFQVWWTERYSWDSASTTCLANSVWDSACCSSSLATCWSWWHWGPRRLRGQIPLIANSASSLNCLRSWLLYWKRAWVSWWFQSQFCQSYLWWQAVGQVQARSDSLENHGAAVYDGIEGEKACDTTSQHIYDSVSSKSSDSIFATGTRSSFSSEISSCRSVIPVVLQVLWWFWICLLLDLSRRWFGSGLCRE